MATPLSPSQTDRPVEDVWFDLTVDDDIDPMTVVTSCGRDTASWKYLGPQLSGVKTYRVKLIYLGYVRDLDEAKKAAKRLNPKYRLLEGQALEPFKKKYPRHNGCPVVFGGSGWRNPNAVCFYGLVACLDCPDGGPWDLDVGEWDPHFRCADGAFSDACWLWPVVEQD